MLQEHTEMKSIRRDELSSSSWDIISTLPEIILETILCFLSTKEAARTSILSNEWRYKWRKIPKLQFYMSDMSENTIIKKQVRGKNMDTRRKPFYDLHQILLLHQGPIHDFTLEIDLWEDYFGLDQILLHLSKNHTLKKLSLSGHEVSDRGKLPMSVFSFDHLTDLYLYHFNVDYQPIFHGFASLRSLYLDDIGISLKTLLHLLSNCPLLKSLTLCCPNLEKIEMWMNRGLGCFDDHSALWKEHSNVWLDHLNELKVYNFKNLKPEMDLVKFVLARSPKLKKVKITSLVGWKQESKMLKTLLDAPRVSPATITIR